jgi:chemotaxis protein CheZ
MDEMVDELLSEESLDRARQLVKKIESGDREDVFKLVSEISSLRDYDLFQNVGKLTRNLHDTVLNIGLQSPIGAIAANEFPDARERLNYVIQLTEESANTTLTVVEESIPIVQESGESATELLNRWQSLCKRELPFDEFKPLSDDIQAFLRKTQETSDGLQSELTKVLMAQGYQDLTGQLIKKVITLVDDVEERLIDLVAVAGGLAEQNGDQPSTKTSKMKESRERGEGPALPSQTEGRAHSQDEVDDVLASLGF